MTGSIDIIDTVTYQLSIIFHASTEYSL